MRRTLRTAVPRRAAVELVLLLVAAPVVALLYAMIAISQGNRST
ncbi:MAG: hypothetical protein ACLT98_14540 [Eggerthellaceae bacterium]